MKPISDMAFYCCGVRMQDAAQASPVCGDVYAKLFMDEYGRRIYDKFKEEIISNASIIVRHRIIDDVLRHMLLSQPDLCIVTIGAGFDSRPYRLRGGTWFELDEPQVITYKNERLPILGCANPLHRVAIDFCTDSLEERLSDIPHGGPTVFILEGVFIYLNESEIKKLLEIFNKLFPKHELICDLVNRQMVEHYGQRLHQIVEEIGASFKPVDTPESIFLINGYRVRETISVAEVSVDLGINKVPKFILRYFFNREIKGNSVYVLEKHDPDLAAIKSNADFSENYSGPTTDKLKSRGAAKPDIMEPRHHIPELSDQIRRARSRWQCLGRRLCTMRSARRCDAAGTSRSSPAARRSCRADAPMRS